MNKFTFRFFPCEFLDVQKWPQQKNVLVGPDVHWRKFEITHHRSPWGNMYPVPLQHACVSLGQAELKYMPSNCTRGRRHQWHRKGRCNGNLCLQEEVPITPYKDMAKRHHCKHAAGHQPPMAFDGSAWERVAAGHQSQWSNQVSTRPLVCWCSIHLPSIMVWARERIF